MQLVAYGAQDIYLTGNPQITFFKIVYRRHTNFSIESIEFSLNGDPNFDRTGNVRLSRNADLISKIYLRILLESVDPEDSNFAYVRRLGHALIRKVEIDIGGTKVDRHYGVWLDIWYNLARHGDLEVGYDKMIGDVPELTEYNSNIKPEYIIYVPLQFWFNRHIGLSIPLIALQYHEVNLLFEFEPVTKVVVKDANFDISKVSMKEVSVIVDYVYLDSEERRRFAQVGHEYLIEQLQFNGVEPANEVTRRYRLDFNHPTKELIWALRVGTFNLGKRFIYYTHKNEWSVNEAACNVILKSVSVGTNPTMTVGGTWFELEPLSNGTVGTINVANRSNQSVYINPTSLKIGDYGITDKINADVVVNVDGSLECNNVETTLTIRDLSISTEVMDDTRIDKLDPEIVLFGKYGCLIDGSINSVRTAILKLNGHDRFDRREGAYFNYVQPDIHHSNSPAEGINVYSFSLYPEQHQPSGTANLSRIDSTDLFITFDEQTLSDASLPPLDLLNDDAEFYIFATNYNILRFMSGLAGIAYSTR